MENTCTTRILLTKEVERKLKSLEERALKLGKDFDRMISRMADLEECTDRCQDQIEVDKKTVSVIELFMMKNDHSRSLLNHVSLFFIVLLKKVQRLVKNVTTVTDLWHRIGHRDVSAAVNSVTEQLGFTTEEHDALRIIFDVIRDRNLSENQGNDLIEQALAPCRRESDDFPPLTSFPGGDTNLAHLIMYLDRLENVDCSIVAALRRMVAVAYCSVVNSATQNVTSPRINRRDVENVNAQVRKIQSETVTAFSNSPNRQS